MSQQSEENSFFQNLLLASLYLIGVCYLCQLESLAFRDMRRSFQASSWQSTEGVIEGGVVETLKSDNKYYDTPYVTYLYAVDGQAYRGSSTYLHDDGWAGFTSYRTAPEARASLNDRPAGKLVTVYYSPNTHEDAVLDRETQKGRWMGGLYFFLGFPLAMWLSVILYREVTWSSEVKLGLLAATIVAWAVFAPGYDGNAEPIDGGPSVVANFKPKPAR